jgi:integrase/recombinase XerD
MQALTIYNTTQELTAPAMGKIADLIETYLSQEDLRPTSRDRYRITLAAFFRWVESKRYHLGELTKVNLLEYKADLLASGRSALTVASYLTSVKAFYNWTDAAKLYHNIGKGVELPKRVRKFRKEPLNPDQCKALIVHYQGKALRDYAIVTLLLRTGLRTIEVSRANIEDLTFKSGKRVLMVQGKGRDEKDAYVVLTDKAYQPIKDYLEARGKTKSGEPLFTSASNNSKGERLTTQAISGIAKEGLRAIGLDGKEFTAHSLRHTAGTNLIRAGAPFTDVQRILRHSNPATTQIYVEMGLEEERLKRNSEALLDGLY